MREKLIELNHASVREFFKPGNAKTDYEEFHADFLIANGVTVQQWIPVLEELPEDEQWVLCIMGNKDFGEFRVFQWSYIDWEWNDGNEWFAEKDVTHWMPLPEPPKGE